MQSCVVKTHWENFNGGCFHGLYREVLSEYERCHGMCISRHAMPSCMVCRSDVAQGPDPLQGPDPVNASILALQSVNRSVPDRPRPIVVYQRPELAHSIFMAP